MSGAQFSTRQIVLLVLLTLVWGLNWPVMKLGVTHFPPLSFRSLSMWLGLPVLYVAVRAMKVPLRIERVAEVHGQSSSWSTETVRQIVGRMQAAAAAKRGGAK